MHHKISEVHELYFYLFRVTPRRNWIYEEFRNGAGVTNIVFSNGLLDPCGCCMLLCIFFAFLGLFLSNVVQLFMKGSSGGVTQNLSDSVQAVVIPEGAHHLDLAGCGKKKHSFFIAQGS